MSQHGGGAKRRPLFVPAEKSRLLSLAIGKPSGIVVSIGGVDIDLVPISNADGASILDLVEKFGAIWEASKNGGIKESEIATAIGRDGARIQACVKAMIRDSIFIEGEDDEDTFDAWFGKLPLVPTMKTLLPVLLFANGLKSMQAGNGQPATPDPIPENATQSTISSD